MRNALVVFCLVMGLASGGAVAAELKIGTVDMQKALQSVEAGKHAKERLEKEFNSKKKELQAEEAAIKKMGEEFKKQSLVLSDEARAKKQGEIQERILKFQETTQKAQVDIQQKERELTSPIIDRLRATINAMAKEKGYSLILERNENNVLYSQDKDDLTDDVVATFNKANKG